MADLLYLSGDDVRRALPMAEAVEAMIQAFVAVSAGDVAMPARTHLDIGQPGDKSLVMPAYAPTLGGLAVKVVNLAAGNPARGLARIQALVTLYDGETGAPRAVLDGAALTAIRTGAAAGAGTSLLARAEADTAVVFGAGVQARWQLAAVHAVRPLRRAWVVGRNPDRAAACAAGIAEALGVPVEPATAAEALAQADIVCTVTTSATPIFDDADLRPGTHLNAMGVYQLHMQEVPSASVARASLFVDQRAAALEEAGDLVIPWRAGLLASADWPELGEVATGQRPGRQTGDEITLFKSVGLAAQDLAAANRAVGNALRLGVGQRLLG